jgi:CheY-like chemotaxis protein
MLATTLPCHPMQESSLGHHRASGSREELHVLVVDDDESIRDSLKVALELSGYRATLACDGELALAWLKHSPPPSLILLDLMMPVMDGWALLAKLRDEPRLASIPVVLITAFGRDLGTAADEPVLQKPIELDHLLQSVALHARKA